MSFKYRVNQVQHESNISIIEDLEELDAEKKISGNLVKQNNLIKIADVTVTGWNAVHEYLSEISS